MSRSLSRLQALVLGLVVVVGLVLAGSGLFAVGSRGWFGQDAFTVRAGFAEIRGVEVGTRVRVQGMDAGEVVAIEKPTKPRGQVTLRLRLKGEFRDLIRVTSQVQIVNEGLIGGKAVEIQPGQNAGDDDARVADGGTLPSVTTSELTNLMDEATNTLSALRNGKGTLGKLATEPKAHDELVAALQQIKEAAASIQQVAEGMQHLPLVGGYVENPLALLERPNSQRDRRVFAEEDLFEPGQAILTARGKGKLDEVAPWLEGMKHKGSEVVVVGYADPTRHANAQTARILTRQQSEAVCEYLKSKHAIQKMGWLSFSRKVTPVGQGVSAPPSPESKTLPAGRVEVVVFVPVQS